MSVFSLRKAAVTGLGAVLIGSALTVGLGSGVASAYDAGTCSVSAERVFSNAGTFGDKYYVTKTVDGDGRVGSDGTVSFITTVRGGGALISEIRDFHPEGFRMTKVESDVSYLVGGQKWKNETAKAIDAGGKVSLGGAGWTTVGGATAAMRVTYKAPAGIMPGEKIDAGGAGFKAVLVNVNPDFKDMNVCLTGRLPNPVEVVGSGLGSLGLGSIADLGGSLTGSFSDPSSPINGLSASLGG